MSKRCDMKPSGLKKIFLIFLGILISFLIIEFSLHIGGYFFQLQTKKGEITKNFSRAKDSLRILCVGDSFTFGVGAKNGDSYPEQLQKLLNEENMKWTVYNLGAGGMNSSTLLLKLPEWIKLYRPRMIVLLIGANDIWNFQNSNYYLFQKGKRVYIYRLENFLFKFRTYKLLKLLVMGMNKLIFGQKENHVNFTPVRKPNPEVEANLELAWKYFNQERDFNKVKEILREVLIRDSQNDEAYFLLGWVHEDSQEAKLAEENLKKAIEINSYNMEAHRELFRLYRNLDKKELAKKELEAMLKISSGDEELKRQQKYGIPTTYDNELFCKQLTYNLIQIVRLSKLNNAIVILQNYPNGGPLYLDESIKSISQKYNAPSIDQAATFRGLSYKDYSASDSHPNGKGYSIMAKNVFAEIKKIMIKHPLDYRLE